MFLRNVGSDYPLKLRHIPKEGSPQPHSHESVKTS